MTPLAVVTFTGAGIYNATPLTFATLGAWAVPADGLYAVVLDYTSGLNGAAATLGVYATLTRSGNVIGAEMRVKNKAVAASAREQLPTVLIYAKSGDTLTVAGWSSNSSDTTNPAGEFSIYDLSDVNVYQLSDDEGAADKLEAFVEGNGVNPRPQCDVTQVGSDSQNATNLAAACAAYSATRGLAGTALPAAAADSAGGLPISDAGALDIDLIAVRVAAILTDTETTLDDKLDALQVDTSQIQTNQATILGRLGAWTGTGINTILGAFKALLSKTASAPSDIGGTFTPTTDSTEAIAEGVASAAAAIAATDPLPVNTPASAGEIMQTVRGDDHTADSPHGAYTWAAPVATWGDLTDATFKFTSRRVVDDEAEIDGHADGFTVIDPNTADQIVQLELTAAVTAVLTPGPDGKKFSNKFDIEVTRADGVVFTLVRGAPPFAGHTIYEDQTRPE